MARFVAALPNPSAGVWGAAYGSRTRVCALRERCPEPDRRTRRRAPRWNRTSLPQFRRPRAASSSESIGGVSRSRTELRGFAIRALRRHHTPSVRARGIEPAWNGLEDRRLTSRPCSRGAPVRNRTGSAPIPTASTTFVLQGQGRNEGSRTLIDRVQTGCSPVELRPRGTAGRNRTLFASFGGSLAILARPYGAS